VRSKLGALAALAIASAASLVACEQIIGLDYFSKCDASVCDAGTNDASLEASVDAGSDALTLPDGVSEASSWAQWRMPNTATEVGLGASDASLRAFDASVPGYLFDEVTWLNWSLSMLPQASSFEQAAGYCAQIGARLPTRIEIASLLDSTRPKSQTLPPEFDVVLQDAGNASLLWTSSYFRPITSNSLELWFAVITNGSGDIRPLPYPQNAGVLCVR
jgi:hypothetical protein